MACGEDPKEPRAAGEAGRAGGQRRRADHLHAGAVSLAVLLPGRGPSLLQAGRDDSRPVAPTRSARLREEAQGRRSSRRCSRSAPPGCITTPPSSSMRTDRILGVYRKMHIPDDPLYYEKFYFTPGDTGFRAWKTRVREDRRADLLGPVVSGRRAAHGDAGRGDSLLPHRDRLASDGEDRVRASAARVVGADPAQPRGRERLLRVRAESHRARAGPQRRQGKPVNPDGIEFWGQSFVAAPDGAIIEARVVDRKSRSCSSDCDLARVEFSRTHWPFLRDRRVDAYGDLTKRFIG